MAQALIMAMASPLTLTHGVLGRNVSGAFGHRPHGEPSKTGYRARAARAVYPRTRRSILRRGNALRGLPSRLERGAGVGGGRRGVHSGYLFARVASSLGASAGRSRDCALVLLHWRDRLPPACASVERPCRDDAFARVRPYIVLAAAACWAPTMPPHVRIGVMTYAAFFMVAGQPFDMYWGLMIGPMLAIWMAYAPHGFMALLGQSRVREIRPSVPTTPRTFEDAAESDAYRALPRVLNGFALVSAAVCIYGIRRADPDFLDTWPTGVYSCNPAVWPRQIHSPTHLTDFPGSAPNTRRRLFLAHVQQFRPHWSHRPQVHRWRRRAPFCQGSRAVDYDDPKWVPAFLLVTLTLVRYFLFRPQLFTFLFFAIFVAITFRFVIQGRAALWCLPPLTIIWANLHGGFVAGLGVLALAMCATTWSVMKEGAKTFRSAAASVRPLVITLVCCLLASLVNPRGVRLWSYISHELLRYEQALHRRVDADDSST